MCRESILKQASVVNLVFPRLLYASGPCNQKRCVLILYTQSKIILCLRNWVLLFDTCVSFYHLTLQGPLRFGEHESCFSTQLYLSEFELGNGVSGATVSVLKSTDSPGVMYLRQRVGRFA